MNLILAILLLVSPKRTINPVETGQWEYSLWNYNSFDSELFYCEELTVTEGKNGYLAIDENGINCFEFTFINKRAHSHTPDYYGDIYFFWQNSKEIYGICFYEEECNMEVMHYIEFKKK